MVESQRRYFELPQTQKIAEAFSRNGVEYLFLGKGGAIILGYPGATQDVDIFVKKDTENPKKIIDALGVLGFNVTDAIRTDILSGKDFVQLKDGPFDLDLIFAPDGIESFEFAKARRHMVEGLPVANIRDIIASKKASGREKDFVDLPLLEDFREEFEKSLRGEIKSAVEIAMERMQPDAE
ncbi:MAG: hypothetical protein ACRD6X_05040 [Pyrinomonadaceae bacterium]